MKFPWSSQWRRAISHPLKLMHYALVFQAFLGFIIIILVCFAALNLGWWTHRETAIALANAIPTLSQPQLWHIFSNFVDFLPETVSAGAATILAILPNQMCVSDGSATEGVWTRRIKKCVGVALAVGLLIIYGAAAMFMFHNPGKDYKKAFEKPPYAVWWSAFTLVIIQWYANVPKTPIQALRSTARILLYLLISHDTSEMEMHPYPSTNDIPPDHSSSTRLASRAERLRSGSSQRFTRGGRDSPQTLLGVTEQHMWQANLTEAEEAPGLSRRTGSLSATVKGREQEVQSDREDQSESGFAQVDVSGHTWSPIQ